MLVGVDFGDERIDIDASGSDVLGVWTGPERVPGEVIAEQIRSGLEAPQGYPALKLAVVPGDRVVLAVDPRLAEAGEIVAAIVRVLNHAGVDSESIRILAPAKPRFPIDDIKASGIELDLHDPDEPSTLSYLANTEQGRRIYLNKALVDADFTMAIGALAHDAIVGLKGPWSVVFPGLSDRDTIRSFAAQARDDEPDPAKPRRELVESFEVGKLLGCYLHMGIVEGIGGAARVIVGDSDSVHAIGSKAFDDAWTFRIAEPAETVVAGIGGSGRSRRDSAGIAEFADALDSARRIVRRGGRIVILSHVDGPIGPALRKLVESGDDRSKPKLTREHADLVDYAEARKIAAALEWADVFVLSRLDPDLLDDLSIIPLDKPEQAQKLVAASRSCAFLSRAERTRGKIAPE